MNEKINEIYERFHGEDSIRDPKVFLKESESIKDQFEKDSFENYDEYFKTTKLVSEYAEALVICKQSDKSLPYFEKAITLINQNEKLKNKNLFQEPIYESLIFHRGIAYYDLKKIIKALRDFKKLVDNFPTNEKYSNWKNASKVFIFNKLEWILLALTIIFIVLSMSLKPEHGIIDTISYFGLAIFLIISIIVRILNKKLRKKVKYTL